MTTSIKATTADRSTRNTTNGSTPVGVFDKYMAEAWPYHYALEMVVSELHGGFPRNPDVVRSWLMAKAGYSTEEEVQAEMERIFKVDPEVVSAQMINDPGAVAEQATKSLVERNVNGFKRNPNTGELYMEGRQLKACVKEGVSVARATNKIGKRFGETGKGVISFAAEHIMVLEDRLPLGVTEHDELHRRFVQTRFGSGITVEEVIFDAKITATIVSDYEFPERDWGMVWLTAGMQGFGASRSQGFGRFTVTRWEPIVLDNKTTRRSN